MLKYTGIGGLGLVLIFVFFRHLISQPLFTKLKHDESYTIIKSIVYGCLVLSLLSLCIYAFVKYNELGLSGIKNKPFNKTYRDTSSWEDAGGGWMKRKIDKEYLISPSIPIEKSKLKSFTSNTIGDSFNKFIELNDEQIVYLDIYLNSKEIRVGTEFYDNGDKVNYDQLITFLVRNKGKDTINGNNYEVLGHPSLNRYVYEMKYGNYCIKGYFRVSVVPGYMDFGHGYVKLYAQNVSLR
ncbi:hypothetical protein [Hymenobacter armeniacus]|uniref:hypothetical protein n=1 Tax=Hymenobacter armeniacus TaxID=2771358 RepID=UPI001CC26C63|nr:hypothetical protein [Hymenobacter armeniacus]